jgi:hypothetical protein
MDKNTINKSSILSTNKTVTPSVQYSTKRFFILIQACLTSFANGYQWFIISSEFHKDFMNTYKLTNFTVNLFSYFYSFSFILTLYIAYILIEKVNYFLSVKYIMKLDKICCNSNNFGMSAQDLHKLPHNVCVRWTGFVCIWVSICVELLS